MVDFLWDWFAQNGFALFNVIMIDVVLAGDNAISVGLAASQVSPELRSRVIFWGIAGAVVLRIIFAGLTTQLLAIIGLTLAGGLLLLWVCWKMYQQIREHAAAGAAHSLGAAAVGTVGPDGETTVKQMSFWTALSHIIIADVSMSLDNVLAVAGAAKGSPMVLVLGLAIAIVLMAVASHYIAGMLAKYPWIMWVGLVIILYVALDMIYDGSEEVVCKGLGADCSQGFMSWMRVSVLDPLILK